MCSNVMRPCIAGFSKTSAGSGPRGPIEAGDACQALISQWGSANANAYACRERFYIDDIVQNTYTVDNRQVESR